MYNRTETIRNLRKNLESGMLIGVATRASGIKSPETLWAWKKKSNCGRLGRLVENARSRGQGNRDDQVEDAQFKRLVDGKASGSEYEFYLSNRRAERWKKEFHVSGPNGVPLLSQPPVINYISVPVTLQVQENSNVNGHHEIEGTKGNGNGNGNGNGRIPHV